MNIYDEQEFLKNIKTLDWGHLLTLSGWLRSRENEKDRDVKVRLINIELDRRLKLEEGVLNEII